MASIKYKDNGTYKDMIVKVGDTLPIGAEMDYEGAEVPNGWEQIDDSWETLTLESEFKNYNNNSAFQPRIKKEGNVVTIEGIVSPINNITNTGSEHIITKIAEKYRPKTMPLHQVCQASVMNRWLLIVAVGGNVTLSRYGTTEMTTVPASSWLPFSITYLV